MDKKNKYNINRDDLSVAMDIVRGMSYEEIQELLKANPLYKAILGIDEENNGIYEESD